MNHFYSLDYVVSSFREGNILALSLEMYVTDVEGKVYYVKYGGVQLAAQLVLSGAPELINDKLLLDEDRNLKSVKRACEGLVSR